MFVRYRAKIRIILYLCSIMMEKRHFWILFVVLCLSTLPWLGCTHFYTKGEPREAVVAQTMLQQDNWTLPHNNGGDIAYKPPFFHWTIAATSQVFGGEVTEWTARFPSALAAICLMIWMYIFYARRRDSSTALLATLICFTCFEVFRAAFACRVDMMLALFTSGAMLAFARWTEKERCGLPWLAILMMSLGISQKLKTCFFFQKLLMQLQNNNLKMMMNVSEFWQIQKQMCSVF